MTTVIEIGERSFAVPPFMLAELEAAAPHIDRMNELRQEFEAAEKIGKVPPMAQMMQLFRSQIEILAIGIANVDPTMTADVIAKSVNFSFMTSLQAAVNALLASSGLSGAGEAKAPKARPAKGAKASRSR